jgi:hypothetical protein
VTRDPSLLYWVALGLAVLLASGSMTAAGIYKHRWQAASVRGAELSIAYDRCRGVETGVAP